MRRSRASYHLSPGFAGQRSAALHRRLGGRRAAALATCTPGRDDRAKPGERATDASLPSAGSMAEAEPGGRASYHSPMSSPPPVALSSSHLARGPGACAAGAGAAVPLSRRPVVGPVPRRQLSAPRPDEAAHVPRGARHRGLPVLVRVELHGHRLGGRDRAGGAVRRRGDWRAARHATGQAVVLAVFFGGWGRSRAFWGCRI